MNSHSKINKYFANINNFTIHLATHNPKQSSTSDSNDASGETNVPLADSYNQNGDKDCDKNSTRQMLTHSSEKNINVSIVIKLFQILAILINI